jgi:D-aspartate ligase
MRRNCFRDRDPTLSNAALRLCRELGYFGIFEIEFVWFNKCWNMIDFNPRLFSQIGMDIARGVPLPLFACLDAAGEREALHDAVAEAWAADDAAKTIFCDRFTLIALLFVQFITSRISYRNLKYWRTWLMQHAANAVDFAADRNDPVPWLVHVVSEVFLGVKAFPRFLRSTPRVPRIDKTFRT